ncbi:alpha/beta hydrolase [Amylibacter sp.]|nr:alpha/beta hydrolase [Amylibacter sp.]
MRQVFIFLISIVLLASTASADSFGKLKGQTFGSGSTAVVVTLHGDVSRGGPADYHYASAKSIAAKNKGVTSIALLRPGYSDRAGQKSGGSNNGRRDHYTKRNNDLVAAALKDIKARYKARKLIVVGHSGGAAQTGAIIGRYPNLIDGAVLVSCPCHIANWRNAKGGSPWPSSQSPHRYLKKVSKSTAIVVINGSQDSNTRPAQAKAYVALAKKSGLNPSYVEIGGAGHGFNKMSRKIASTVGKMTR